MSELHKLSLNDVVHLSKGGTIFPYVGIDSTRHPWVSGTIFDNIGESQSLSIPIVYSGIAPDSPVAIETDKVYLTTASGLKYSGPRHRTGTTPTSWGIAKYSKYRSILFPLVVQQIYLSNGTVTLRNNAARERYLCAGTPLTFKQHRLARRFAVDLTLPNAVLAKLPTKTWSDPNAPNNSGIESVALR